MSLGNLDQTDRPDDRFVSKRTGAQRTHELLPTLPRVNLDELHTTCRLTEPVKVEDILNALTSENLDGPGIIFASSGAQGSWCVEGLNGAGVSALHLPQVASTDERLAAYKRLGSDLSVLVVSGSFPSNLCDAPAQWSISLHPANHFPVQVSQGRIAAKIGRSLTFVTDDNVHHFEKTLEEVQRAGLGRVSKAAMKRPVLGASPPPTAHDTVLEGIASLTDHTIINQSLLETVERLLQGERSGTEGIGQLGHAIAYLSVVVQALGESGEIRRHRLLELCQSRIDRAPTGNITTGLDTQLLALNPLSEGIARYSTRDAALLIGGALWLDGERLKSLELLKRAFPAHSSTLQKREPQLRLSDLSTFITSLEQDFGITFRNPNFVREAFASLEDAQAPFTAPARYSLVGELLWEAHCAERHARAELQGNQNTTRPEQNDIVRIGSPLLSAAYRAAFKARGSELSRDEKAQIARALLGVVYHDQGLTEVGQVIHSILKRNSPAVRERVAANSTRTLNTPSEPTIRERLSEFAALGLSDVFLEGIERRGWVQPLDIQSIGIKGLIEGKSALLLAQTGRGKTGAVLLPTFERLSKRTSPLEIALVIASSEALATQITEEAKVLCGTSELVVKSATELPRQRVRGYKHGGDIIVGTPQSILERFKSDVLDPENFSIVVVDEIDLVLEEPKTWDIEALNSPFNAYNYNLDGSEIDDDDMDWEDEEPLSRREALLELVRHLRPPQDRQTIILSGTLSNENLPEIARLIPGGEIVDASYDTPLQNLTHKAHYIDQLGALATLRKILEETGKGSTIVVVDPPPSHREMAESLAYQLNQMGIRPADARGRPLKVKPLSGGLSDVETEKALDEFRRGRSQVLISTPDKLRGLDIPHVRRVVLFDLPRTIQMMVQSAGRAGRGVGTQGDVHLLVRPHEQFRAKVLYQLLGVNHTVATTSAPPTAAQNEAMGAHQRSPKDVIDFVQGALGCTFDDPSILLTACSMNPFHDDPRATRQHLNFIGRTVFALALSDAALQVNSRPHMSVMTDALNGACGIAGSNAAAVELGLDTISARDRVDHDENYYTNAAQMLFNVMGAMYLDGRPWDEIVRAATKAAPDPVTTIGTSPVHQVSPEWEPTVAVMEAIELATGTSFKDRSLLAECLTGLNFFKGLVEPPPALQVTGRNVLRLVTTDLVRRSGTFDIPVAELRDRCREYCYGTGLLRSGLTTELLHALESACEWVPHDRLRPQQTQHLVEGLIGALYLDQGFAAVENFVQRMHPQLLKEAEIGDRRAGAKVDLDELRALLAEEGEALQRRGKKR